MPIDAIAQRRSPRAFDPDAALAEGELTELLEAARWAPSAHNRQPWAFLVGRRGDASFQRIAGTLMDSNRRWAPKASALLVAMVDNEHAAAATSPGRAYELGLAVGQLGVQAEAMGLITHQMAGFRSDELSAAFALPAALRPMVVIAVGRPGDPDRLPEDLRLRERAARVRRPLGQWVSTEERDDALAVPAA